MAPVVLELRRYPAIDTVLASTGQHKEMLEQALGAFGLQADEDLAIMQHGQTLADVTARAVEGLDKLYQRISPDWVLGQGDTTTVFAAALTAFYRQIPFGHVEAGLRTPTIDNPFPEEFNRRAAGLVTTMHWAPTKWAAQNLMREGKDPTTIFITGNTGIDAVIVVIRRLLSGQPITQADKRHLHHQLLGKGLSPRQTVWVLYTAAFVLCALILVVIKIYGKA